MEVTPFITKVKQTKAKLELSLKRAERTVRKAKKALPFITAIFGLASCSYLNLTPSVEASPSASPTYHMPDYDATQTHVALVRPNIIPGTATAQAENPKIKEDLLNKLPDYYKKAVMQIGYGFTGYNGMEGEFTAASTGMILTTKINSDGDTIAMFLGVNPYEHREFEDIGKPLNDTGKFVYRSVSEYDSEVKFHEGKVIDFVPFREYKDSDIAFWLVNLGKNPALAGVEPAGLDKFMHYDRVPPTEELYTLGFPGNVDKSFVTQVNFNGRFFNYGGYNLFDVDIAGFDGASGEIIVGKDSEKLYGLFVRDDSLDTNLGKVTVFTSDVENQAQTAWQSVD